MIDDDDLNDMEKFFGNKKKRTNQKSNADIMARQNQESDIREQFSTDIDRHQKELSKPSKDPKNHNMILDNTAQTSNSNISSLDNKETTHVISKTQEQPISKSDIRQIVNLLQQIAEGVIELQGIKPYTYDDKGRDTTRRGRVHVFKYLNYYDVTNTIKRAGLEDPQDFDSPVYNIERIYEVLERYSDVIHVINGGTSPLFLIVSHEGRTNFSKESIIFPGEVKDFYNVYELRLRSPEAGLQYRVTEYLIMSVSQTSLIPIELASLHDVELPNAGDDWLDKDLVPLIFPTTFRIEVSTSKTGIFSAAITNHDNTQVVNFNVTSGPELIEDGVYVFELLVHKGDSVNFRYSADGGRIRILRVQEIDAATA